MPPEGDHNRPIGMQGKANAVGTRNPTSRTARQQTGTTPARAAQFSEVDTLVQRILEAGDIESLDHTAIPRIRTPERLAVFSARAAATKSGGAQRPDQRLPVADGHRAGRCAASTRRCIEFHASNCRLPSKGKDRACATAFDATDPRALGRARPGLARRAATNCSTASKAPGFVQPARQLAKRARPG